MATATPSPHLIVLEMNMPPTPLLFLSGIGTQDVLLILLALAILVLPPIVFFKFFLLRKYQRNENEGRKEEKSFGRLKYLLYIIGIGLVASILLSQSPDPLAINVIAALFATAAMEKRIRDIGFSRWWAILGLTPMVPHIGIVGMWAHILCLITPSLRKKSVQTTSQNENKSELWTKQSAHIKTDAVEIDSSRKQRIIKYWIVAGVVIIPSAIALITFAANRSAVNKELSPLILATELNPDDPYAWTSLAGKAYRLKRYSTAEDAAKKAIKSGVRGKSGGYLWLGRIYREQGEVEEAIYCYQRSSGFHARTDLGDLYLELGDYENSTREYSKAIDLLLKETQRDDAGWWDWGNLGDAYLKLGMKEQAHDAFATALTLGKDLDWIEEKMAITQP